MRRRTGWNSNRRPRRTAIVPLHGPPGGKKWLGGARFARLVCDLGEEHGVNCQIWIQGFGLGPEDADDIRAAVEAARGAGLQDLWTWGYEACGHISHLGTREPERVWAVLTEALTGGHTGVQT